MECHRWVGECDALYPYGFPVWPYYDYDEDKVKKLLLTTNKHNINIQKFHKQTKNESL